MTSRLRYVLLCAAVFLGTFFYLYDLVGDVFHPSLDEGIYLEGGERVLGGQVPYRDFFVFTGPVIYWTQAALEKTFGRHMPLLRLSAMGSLAAMTLVVFALTLRFTDWGYGLGAAVVYLGYLSASTFLVIVNHRWLSAALASLALWAAVEAAKRTARPALLWGVAGVAAALAAWTTPTFILGVGVYLGWLIWREREYLLPFCGGVLVVSLPLIGWLAAQGALLPMIDNLLWLGSRYSKANAVPYGYNPGGMGIRFGDPALNIYGNIMTVLVSARYFVAPIGAPLVLLGYAVLAWRRQLDAPRQLLALGAAAIFATTYPRWDMNQMLFVMAPFCVLVAIQAFRLPVLAQPVVSVIFLMWAALNFSSALSVGSEFQSFPTRAGIQRGHLTLLEGYEKLERLIPEGATLFAFPYQPSLGFALHTRNPTRYAFLQPGMMSKQDEARALGDLERQPPRFILRQYFPDDQVLNTWPNSDRSTLAMASIRQYIDRRYRFVDVVQSIYYRVEVLELNP
ncbi:MAG: hypothetical protein K2X03_00775 [Bryobacteraceae bacterium]|nr:hypothetical protein [Bryobacteraceae bacterium]